MISESIVPPKAEKEKLSANLVPSVSKAKHGTLTAAVGLREKMIYEADATSAGLSGLVAASALFLVTMTAVLQAPPMVQAVLLLGIYALLPMIVVLSRYSISMMIIGAMAIFTVKF